MRPLPLPTLALTLGGILVLTGCLAAFDPATRQGPAPGSAVSQEPFRTLEQGSFSRINATEWAAITNESQYRALWARHTGDPSAVPPAVNFSVDRVVAIFAGDQPDSCRQAKVINASTDAAAKVTTVRWNVTSPPPDTSCAMVVTQPYVLVALKQRDTTLQVQGPAAAGDSAPAAEGRELEAVFKEVTEKRYAVFRDARSWERALQPGTVVPPVDFTRDMVVAVFMGPAPNGCHGVELGRITPLATHTEVEVRYRGPAADAYCTEMFGWPTLAYAVPKAENVSFKESYTDLASEAPRTPQKVGSATFLRADEAPGISERRVVLVEDQSEWVALWAQAHPGSASAPPAVDFTKHRVVASFLGADTATCISATGVGHVHEPAQGELLLDMLVWMAGPGVNCVRHASHTASYYTIPATGTVTTRDVYVNVGPPQAPNGAGARP